jgi:acetylornithine deacetylase/succinyl-diaminopimelate desuccinylase-like protein
VTGDEEEASKFYAETLHDIGLDAKLEYVAPKSPNVIATIHGKGDGPNLLLNDHIDTVPPKNCPPPYAKEGILYGRGVLDAKCGLAVMAEVARALVDSRIKLGGDVTLTAAAYHEVAPGWPYDESLDPGEGVRRLVAQVRAGKLKADAALVMEGYADKIVIATKGLSFFEFDIMGPSDAPHATAVPFEANPITEAGRLLEFLAELNAELRREVHPLTGANLLNVGIIQGGDYFNRIPSMCRIIGFRRWNPGQGMKESERDFAKVMEKFRSQSKSEIRLAKHKLIKPSYEISRDESIVRLAQSAYREVTGRDAPIVGAEWGCDASIFHSDGRIPAVHLGPLSEQNQRSAHSDNEHVEVSVLEPVAKICAMTVLDFCRIAG